MDPNTSAVLRRINEETADIHGIGVDVCGIMPTGQVLPRKMLRFSKAIVTDIFKEAGLHQHQAKECFERMAERICTMQLLRYSNFEGSGGTTQLRQRTQEAIDLQTCTRKFACVSAITFVSAIAAIIYRNHRPNSRKSLNKPLATFFGEMNGAQWLPVAIEVYDKTDGDAFVIELEESSERPRAVKRDLDGKQVWIVTTRMPSMNKYEGIFHSVFCSDGGVGPTMPKLEPRDQPLPSVEATDTEIVISNKLSPPDDDGEMEDNVITLRDYTQQMKSLGKRLATPDRAIVKRLRREIMKKPDHPEQQEQEVEFDERLRSSLKTDTKHALNEAITDVGQQEEHFDAYTHYKDVWKICLRNQAGIPNSLRRLVEHHCTTSQVFYLTELEKEYLAEMEMEVDV